MKKRNLTIHHIIPKSRFEEVDTSIPDANYPDNLIKLKSNIHEALHTLFSNKHPREQLRKRYEINRQVISKKAEKLLVQLFTMPDWEFYK